MDTECQELLSELKSTVENIASQSSSNGLSHRALSKLYVVVESIFKHECKVFDGQVRFTYQLFFFLTHYE